MDHPPHYNSGSMEVIDAIEGLGLDKDFLLGNVVKYVARAQYRGKELEDLKKARWYLMRKISKLEKTSDLNQTARPCSAKVENDS